MEKVNIPLNNCEVELILTWWNNCVLADVTVWAAQRDNPAIVAPLGLEFQITDKKWYVSVVTFSKENDKKLLEQLKSGFKRTIKWNKYRSQITIQPQNNNLNYLIDHHLQMLIDYFFCLLQEVFYVIKKTLFHIIMHQRLK